MELPELQHRTIRLLEDIVKIQSIIEVNHTTDDTGIPDYKSSLVGVQGNFINLVKNRVISLIPYVEEDLRRLGDRFNLILDTISSSPETKHSLSYLDRCNKALVEFKDIYALTAINNKYHSNFFIKLSGIIESGDDDHIQRLQNIVDSTLFEMLEDYLEYITKLNCIIDFLTEKETKVHRIEHEIKQEIKKEYEH